jgi:cytidylate kinase
LYRLTALAAQQAGVDWADEAGVAAIAAGLDVEFSEADIRLNGQLVGDAIRTEEISAGASKVAALPKVRDALLVPPAGLQQGARSGWRRARHGLRSSFRKQRSRSS